MKFSACGPLIMVPLFTFCHGDVPAQTRLQKP